MGPPQNYKPPYYPVPQPEPTRDPFPPLNDPDTAPDLCKQTCSDERLAQLTKDVTDKCKGKLETCLDDDPYWVLKNKWNTFNECAKARRRRERECLGGGDKGHVKQIKTVEEGRKNCDRILNQRPPQRGVIV